MEAVAPLFENPQALNQMLGKFESACQDYGCYGDVDARTIQRYIDRGDLEGAAEEMTSYMSTQDGGEAPDEAYELAKEMVADYLADFGDMGQEMARYEDAEQPVVEANTTDAIEALHNIMDQLGELSSEARAIVEAIDPTEVRRLDAYGAFDFGSSRNPYDTTLASFVEDLESGQYDERD